MERNGNITAAVVDIHTASVSSSKTNKQISSETTRNTFLWRSIAYFHHKKNLRFPKLNQLRDINIASENMMKGNSVRWYTQEILSLGTYVIW